MTQTRMQIGKNGLTSGVIESLRISFKKHQLVKISILKSAGREREKVKEMGEKIVSNLGNNYTCKIIGFTLIVRKWRRAVSRN